MTGPDWRRRFAFPRLLVLPPRNLAPPRSLAKRRRPQVFEAGAPSVRGLALMALAAAGRGGEGSAGQRIRDEILAIQHRSGCKVRPRGARVGLL